MEIISIGLISAESSDQAGPRFGHGRVSLVTKTQTGGIGLLTSPWVIPHVKFT